MDDEKLAKFSETITSKMLILQKRHIELKVSLNVLQLILATMLSPDRPEEGVRQIREREQQVLNSDSDYQELKAAVDMISAAKLSGGLKNDA